jgi:hypothetical protein
MSNTVTPLAAAVDNDGLYQRLAARPGLTDGVCAALWLLHRHGRWLPKLSAWEAVYGLAVEWSALPTFPRFIPLQPGLFDAQPGDWAILQAAALLSARSEARMPDLSGLTPDWRDAVMYAFAWAGCGKQWADSRMPGRAA